MRTAKTILTVIQERGKQHKPIERVYKCRATIVDDNTEYLQFLSSVLSGDFDTIKATGVEDALNILQAITVDAICSDFNMRDGTGLDLLEDIRQRGISVPFLLMSGNDDYWLVQQTKLYGGIFCCKTDYDLIAKIKALNNSEP